MGNREHEIMLDLARYRELPLEVLCEHAKEGDPIAFSYLQVAKFNLSVEVGDIVELKLSDVEDLVRIRTLSKAEIRGDSTPVVALETIGEVLLERIEPLPWENDENGQVKKTPSDIVAGILFGLGLGMGFLPIAVASLIVKQNLFTECFDRMNGFWRSRGWQ